MLNVNRTEQNRTEQNRTEQSRAEQNTTQHNTTQHNTTEQLNVSLYEYYCREGFDHAKCFYMNGTATWYGPDLVCNPIGNII